MHAARPRKARRPPARKARRRQSEPVEPEVAYRRLVAATILRAVRDLRIPTECYGAAHWLAHEGSEWAMLLDLDVTKLKV